MSDDLVKLVREIYGTTDFIPLHEPCFNGNEKAYILETIESTFVSSVGAFVNEFEQKVADYTGAKYAIATVNGTTALHLALLLAGVESGDEVITQSLTFVATTNAIRYCGAHPVFVDVSRETLGLSPDSLEEYLVNHCEMRNDGYCWDTKSDRIIKACLPMHTFGFPAEPAVLREVCDRYNIVMVEDAAESLGSYDNEQHTGTFGKLAVLSFNGNKIITTGGGGMVLTNDSVLASRAKHLTTTAKEPHRWAYSHDEVGFNYRLPNLNAALGVAQMELLQSHLSNKRELAGIYQAWGANHGVRFIKEPAATQANYWLNALISNDKAERNSILEITNDSGVMTRPAWTPMHKLPMNEECLRGNLDNTEWLYDRLVNVPSSVRNI